jgi:hypothetical protein
VRCEDVGGFGAARKPGDLKMIDKHDVAPSEKAEVFTGQVARRNFIKNSGRLAVAAPAVALLLSASSKSSLAAIIEYAAPPANPPATNS